MHASDIWLRSKEPTTYVFAWRSLQLALVPCSPHLTIDRLTKPQLASYLAKHFINHHSFLFFSLFIIHYIQPIINTYVVRTKRLDYVGDNGAVECLHVLVNRVI
jgi:hypothetical protein